MALGERLGQGLTPPTGLFCSRKTAERATDKKRLSTMTTATGFSTHAQLMQRAAL